MSKHRAITGVTGSLTAKVIADSLKEGESALIIVPGRKRSETLAQDLSFFCGKDIMVLPPDEDVLRKYDAKNQDREIERSRIVSSIRNNGGGIVIAPSSGVIKRMPKFEQFERRITSFGIGDEKDLEDIKLSLVEIGYERVQTVYAPGQFSLRGGLLDVFSPHMDHPCRIEFFGDEIDSIRSFDIESQRSIENLDSVEILPANSYEEGSNEYDYLWDYMADAHVFIEDPDRVMEYLDLRYKELWNDLEYLVATGDLSKEEGSRITGPEDMEILYRKRDISFLLPFAKEIKGVNELLSLESYHYMPCPSYNNHLEIMGKDIQTYFSQGYKITIVSSTDGRVESLKDFLLDNELETKATVVKGYLSNGLILPDEKIFYISDNDIFQSSKKLGRRKKRYKGGRAINSFTELTPGEYVVHDNHGIGVFRGIEEIKSQGIVRDYIKITYQGHGVLYVPVDQVDMVQKYIGAEGKTPKINRLGSDEWKRTKARAKKAISLMMDELVSLYAKRKEERGYSFSEDTVWQREFEDSFPYEETEDQLKAVEEIKVDMEKEEPMDRLLCGDVGYGKTEVAARAVFKCLVEGKQAAILVPTTILASQHFNTFRERFKNYPFTIELMSRFRSDKDLKKVAEGLSSGKVDLVIGTHRLLSSDVSFRDLGLLVVDEEQRFGVQHKEKIKMLRAGVDVLTLSATPIPRTLNMSLTGIRDMSLITEPPEDRYPVQTYVLEEDDGILREVINRELDRGGQVFLVYNRVHGIYRIAERIGKLVPDAKIAVGHGQMGEATLEDVMNKFVDGEVDILIATTIVESGLDIPNANTMVVLDADKCGLSQLYQLRGRVGRSNRIAYAYLMYQRDKVLTEIAEKRLRAVREFTEFGAGFKIAMRDMELRGAGNLLGAEQSGHMIDVGYEMYTRLVEEASRKAKGLKARPVENEISIELRTMANIPSWYIGDEPTKLSIYKRIADIQSESDADDVIDEIVDRFGDPPKEVINLIKISRIRSLGKGFGISLIQEINNEVFIYLDKETTVPIYAIAKISEKYGNSVFYHSGKEGYFSFKSDGNGKLDTIIDILKILSDENAYKEVV